MVVDVNGRYNRAGVYDAVGLEIRACLKVDGERIGEDVKLMEGLGAESIDALDLFFRLEKRIGVNYEDLREDLLGRYKAELRKIKWNDRAELVRSGITVGSIVDCVCKGLEKKGRLDG